QGSGSSIERGLVRVAAKRNRQGETTRSFRAQGRETIIRFLKTNFYQFSDRPKLMPWAQKSVRVSEKTGDGAPTRGETGRAKPGVCVVLITGSIWVPGGATLSRYRKVYPT